MQKVTALEIYLSKLPAFQTKKRMKTANNSKEVHDTPAAAVAT